MISYSQSIRVHMRMHDNITCTYAMHMGCMCTARAKVQESAQIIVSFPAPNPHIHAPHMLLYCYTACVHMRFLPVN